MADLKRERPPFTIIGNAIIEDAAVSHAEILVYLVLCFHADKQGSCFPSYATIAGEARISRRMAVSAVAQLVKRCYVTKERRQVAGNRERDSNLYVVKDQYLYVPLQGGAPGALRGAADAPQVVHTVHGGGAPGAQEPDPMNQIQLNKSVGASSAPTEAYTDAFQTFWRAYPKRVEKRKAWRCWKIRLRAGATADQMTAAAGNYARSVEGKDRQFVKHPSTFLGPDEPWREYVEGAPPAGGVGDGFFDSRAVNR